VDEFAGKKKSKSEHGRRHARLSEGRNGLSWDALFWHGAACLLARNCSRILKFA
jgi:hypothetical protein